MCQLMGMNCNTPTDVLFSFTGFAKRSAPTDQLPVAAGPPQGDDGPLGRQRPAQAVEHGGHSDGWGIAFFEGKGLRHFVDHQAACESPVAELIRRYPIKSKNVIAHIRKATQGVINLQNCHPFVRELWGRYWVFAHNGDLKDFAPRLHSSFRPVGSTDSELAFCWIMQELAKSHAGVPSVAELTLTLRELAAAVSPHGTFNFMLSNGEALWAHANTHLWYTERRHPFAHAQLADEDLSVDFSQATTPQDRVAVVVTTPLTTNELWTPFAPGELHVFVDGAHLPA